MESNFNKREFEQYVKSNADQYRMIPSEKVWKGINNTLHTRRRWYGFGLTFLLLLTGVSVTWVMVSYPVSKKQEIASDQNIKTIRPSVQIQPVKQGQASVPAVSNDISNILSINKFTDQDNNAPATDKQFNVSEQSNDINVTDLTSLQITGKISDHGSVLQTNRVPAEIIIISEKSEVTGPSADIINSLFETDDIPASGKRILEDKPTGFLSFGIKAANSNYYPLTIESVINSYQVKKMSRRLTWQLYIAPTVSYRKLSVNKSYEGSIASPLYPTNYPFASSKDVNSEVVHKPDLGMELGVSTKYPLTKYLKLIGGLQFNINRYDIKAFAYSGEPATINLNGGNGNNSVTAWTYYRNYNGYKSNWLKNYYFSVSAPVGAELRLAGNNKTYIGVGGAIQPTYILKERAFLISSDYKNYVEIPRLVRHLNVNTSFETFISHTSRNTKTRWQIGPQVRYQLLSSFQNKYPVKENLFDFGLKVGVSLNH
jgi:hypothetical protein